MALESGDVDTYLLCATPRSGSTLLCGLLRSTGVAGRPESYFRREVIPDYADRWRVPHTADGLVDIAAYVRAVVAAGSTPNGVCGVRIMWGTMTELTDALTDALTDDLTDALTDALTEDRADAGYVEDSPTAPADETISMPPATSPLRLLGDVFGRGRFLHLRRADVLAQAVSWARAEQSHYWHPGEERVPGGREPVFDRRLIAELADRIDDHEAAWQAWFTEHGVDPLDIGYEELAADPVGLTRSVLSFLGLSPTDGQPITVQDRRQADTLNADWIRRMGGESPSPASTRD